MRKIQVLVLILCMSCGILACGKGNSETQTGDGMTWQENYDMGVRLLSEGKYEEAILAFQAAIQIDPKNADAYCGLAEAYLYSGDSAMAASALQDGLNHCDNEEVILDRAADLGFLVGADGSIGGLTWQGQYDLGIRLLESGKYEEAILAFQAAITIDPKQSAAYASMAEAYNRSGDLDGAMAALQNGLDYGDDTDLVIQYVSRLGFYVDENGNVKIMTEEESIAESLAALETTDRISYYISKQRQDNPYQWLFENNITLFGQDVMYLSLKDVVSIGTGQGWNVGKLKVERYSGIPFTYVVDSSVYSFVYAQLYDEGASIGLGMTWLEIGYKATDYAGREQFDSRVAAYGGGLPEGGSIGMLDLCFGDSLSTALAKLGFAYAEEIAAAAGQWPVEEGETNRKQVSIGGMSIQDAAEGEKKFESVTLSYEVSNTAVNGYYQDWLQIEIYVSRNVSGEGSQSTVLELYFYGPEYELWGYHIMNTY